MTTICRQSSVFTHFLSLTFSKGSFSLLNKQVTSSGDRIARSRVQPLRRWLQVITEGCLLPAGLLPPVSAAHSFCDPRTHAPICREAPNFILGIMVVVIGGTLGPCYPQAHRRLCHALDEVLGCFAVSHCLSGTTAEPWRLSQGREDAPMPLPTCLRYGEGRISSAHHWHQLLLSLPVRPHTSLDHAS